MKKIVLLIISLIFTAQTIQSQTVVLDANNVTIKWTGTSVPSPYFVQANPRGTGMEWFAIVDNTTKENITSYAQNIQSGITFFTRPSTTTPIPFNNIVTTLVTNMNLIFSSANAFNQNIGSWDVSNVSTMLFMFTGATIFNQPIDLWNVSNVTNMMSMFNGATAFNQPLGSWNVSKVTNMSLILNNATAFNQPIESWNVSKVTDMSNMFAGATAFNKPIGSWNVSNVTFLNGMFFNAISFNQPIESWDVSNVTSTSSMFYKATAFNQPLGAWNVSNVTTMSQMFYKATAFNQPLGAWNVSNITILNNMFKDTKLSTANYDTTLIGWASKEANGGILQQGVNFDGGASSYCNSSDARNYLINTYKWVITDDGLNCNDFITEVNIGTQTWTVKNLDVSNYSDGTAIPQVTDPTEWSNLTTGAWCYYNNESSNDITYGKLYNWYAVVGKHDNDPNTPNKKLAPTGYHVPTDEEWTTLTTYLGGESVAGGKMKSTGTSLWLSPNTGATNSSGFSGLPGGHRYSDGPFYNFGLSGDWWSSSEFETTKVWSRSLNFYEGTAIKYYSNKYWGFSVRCLRDSSLSNLKFETNSLKLYPNPVVSVLNIKVDYNLINQTYTIIDALGKVVLKGKLNDGDTAINVENLSKGIYYIKVSDNKASKFIKE
jgi:uncharacterized protein (TIGR02145 family)